MRVTIVDRSEKAALRKTRQVLCRYLDRISQETYIGNISQDGLLNLRNDLLSSKGITKQASISAYLHRNGKGPELIWTLGSKARTSSEGVYAYRVKSIKARRRDIASPLLDFMLTAVRLAGLFHDLGKGTVGFNQKLKDAVSGTLAFGGGQDPIRHELISTLLIDVDDPSSFISSLSTGPGLTKAFEERRLALASNESKANILKALQAALKIAENAQTGDVCELDYFASTLSINDTAKWQAHPFWMSVIWLVLTHHKLPAGAWNKQRGCFTSLLNRHAGIRRDGDDLHIHELERLDDFLDMPEKDQPWTHREWVRSVNRCVKRLEQLKTEHPDFEGTMVGAEANHATPWLSSLARLGRLSLVMGDYEASCDAIKDTCSISPDEKLFANTKQIDDKNHLADFLHVHLQKVGHFAPQILTQLFINQDRQFFSPVRLDQYEVPLQLAVPPAVEPGLYEWQGHAQKQIAQYRHTEKGFFCVMAAGTGRGKTRACAALMSNSRLNPRFSVLLSMRSLTYQTALAYLGDTVGFRADQVALFVGDDVLKKRFRSEGKSITEKHRQSLANIGTENLLHDPEQEVFSVLYTGTPRATLNLSSLKTDHFLMRMLSAPVTVMTVDHIIRLVDLSRSKELLALLHLMSTDLILDEIDDYKGDDLICIGRLIEMAGQFGRRVIIASATLPKTIIEAFRSAYLKGYDTYLAIYGGDQPDGLIVTHHSPFFSKHESGEYGDFYDLVMGDFVDKETKAAQDSPRRIVIDQHQHLAKLDKKLISHQQPPMRLIAANEYEGSHHVRRTHPEAAKAFFQATLMSCIKAHTDNALTDPQTGVQYSAGFVRFNTVATAQRFISHLPNDELFKQFEGRYSFKLICYHAQNLGIIRTLQEQFLERHLNRAGMNHGEADPFTQDEDVRTGLLEAHQSGREMIAVVVTSSIMETGRDFDFDWCVLEPSSTTSIVQAGGRVRRHRLETRSVPNVLVMPLALEAMTNEGRAWRFLSRANCSPAMIPRPEHASAMKHLKIDTQAPLPSRPVMARQGLSEELLNARPLHAGHCLSTPASYADASLTVMERVAQLGVLLVKFAPEGAEHKTLGYATNQADILLCNAFYSETRFRGKEAKMLIQYLRDEQGWFCMSPDGTVRHIGHAITESFPGDTDGLFLLSALNVKGMGHMLAISARAARMLGCRGDDVALAEATLLSTSRAGEEVDLIYNPQTGFQKLT